MYSTHQDLDGQVQTLCFFSHKLLITKVYANDLDENSFGSMHGYQSSEKQKTKVGSSHSNGAKMWHGISQGLILDPIFNIKDIFSFFKKSEMIILQVIINISYSCCKNLFQIKKNLLYVTSKKSQFLIILGKKAMQTRCR